MTVAFGAIGTGANGSTTVAPSYPSGITAGQLLLCVVTSGATNSETPTTPSGWIFVATGASTDGTYGVDTGPRRATAFMRVADGSESGTLTVSITNGGTCRGTISRFTSSTGRGWLVRGSGANDSTSGTGVSMTFAAMDWKVGDVVLVGVGQRVDTATLSAQSLTATGITFGTRTNRADTAVTTGNDHRHVVDTFAATSAGTGSQAATWAYTASAAASAGGVLIQIRELGDVAEALTFTPAQSESAASLNSSMPETIGLAAAATLSVTVAPTREVNEILVGLAGHAAILLRRVGIGEASIVAFNKAQPESVTLTAAQTEASTLNSARAESVTLSAAQDENSSLHKDQAEALTLTAASTGIAGRAGDRAETISLTAAQTEASTLNSARAESLGFSDSSSRNSSLNSTRSEAFTLAAASVGSINSIYAKQRDESISLTDASNRTTGFARQASESLAFADSSSVPVGRSTNERLVGLAGHAVFRRIGAGDSSVSLRSESISFADAQSEFRSTTSARAEALSLTAAQANTGFNAARAESFGLTEASSEVSTLPRTVAETLTLDASPIGSTGAVKSRAESIAFSDASTGFRGFAAGRADTLSLTDSVAVSSFVLRPPRFNPTLVGERRESLLQPWAMDANLSVDRAEEVTFSQAATATRTGSSVRSDVVSFAESAIESTQFAKATQEALSLSAAQDGSKGVLFVLQCDEGLSLAATASEVSSLNITRVEAIGLTDASSESNSSTASCAESFGLTAAQDGSKQPIYSMVRDEVLGLSDSASASVNHSVFVKQTGESIGFTEAQSQVPSLNASKTEVLLINEAVSSVAGYQRFMAETLGFSDSTFILTGPYAEEYRYDVPGTAGAYVHDIVGGSFQYDVPPKALSVTL